MSDVASVLSPAVETRRLTKRFRRLGGYRDLLAYAWRPADRVAVDAISLRVERGELFGVLGQNGAGKTTLLRMLATTLLPTSGSASVAGCDVERDPRGVRRRIGLVSGDERSFYLRLTGRQNLEFFASLFHVRGSEARRRVGELSERLGIADILDHRYSEYSSGQRQKLAIVRGLLTRPEVVLMDEPTRALDPIAAHAVRRFIADDLVGELGCTVLLATHSTVEAEELCHRLALIREGRLAAIGTIDELRRSVDAASHGQVRVRQVPDGLLDEIRRLPCVAAADIEPNGSSQKIQLRLSGDGDGLNAVLGLVLARGAIVTGASTMPVSLEEIYLAAHEPVAEAGP